MILTCDCNHDFQDKRYGYKRRVFNRCKETNKFRCTVCGKTQTYTEKGTVVAKEKQNDK